MFWSIVRWGLVVLWAVEVVAFLVYFFRGWRRGFWLWSLGLPSAFALVVLQAALMNVEGYGHFVGFASRIGRGVSIFVIAIFVTDLLAMTIYTIRQGEPHDQKSEISTEKRPLTSMTLGPPKLMGRSKIKVLGRKHKFVSMKSLVNGTATFAEHMIVLGIISAFLSFGLLWFGAGLMLVKYSLIAILFFVPCLWVYYHLRDMWAEYRNAKRQFGHHHSVHQVTQEEQNI